MLYDKGLTGLQLDTLEICINLWYESTTPSSMEVNIPKLMPHIGRGEPAKSYNKVTINDKIFANDSKCKINTGKLTTTQNYLTLRPHSNRSVSYSGRRLCEHDNMSPGQKFLCEIVQGDIRNIHLTDKL